MTDRRRVGEILTERARALAAVTSGETAALTTAEDHLVLTIAAQRIAVRLSSVEEVVSVGRLAPVPHAPAWLRGIAHVRGSLLAVVDLALWWRLQDEAAGKYLVVLAGRAGALGITTDADMEIRPIEPKELVAADAPAAVREGVTAMTRDLISIVDVDTLLAHPELVVEARRTKAVRQGARDG